jgi:catechol 2,3-dioxygenase-like lactoylglutathione lyase family enzyme
MAVEVAKDSIDIGMVVRDVEGMLHFYQDVLGFEREAVSNTPSGATMYRLRCGSSLVKLLVPATPPGPASPSGGLEAATGIRWWTIIVSNLAEIAAACEADGRQFPMPVRSPKPGTMAAIVADPDGNLVELIQRS